MSARPYNLAIETSGRSGSVTLGLEDELIESIQLPHKRRHNVELIPMIDKLCRKHGVTPDTVGQVYVSLGPGSFTGLRVGITTAKMLALASGAKIFGIPTLEVLVENAPPEAQHAAVCLNLKRDTVHCAVYSRDGNDWSTIVEPALRTMNELLAASPKPVSLIGDPLPPGPDHPAEGVTILGPERAVAQSQAVWRLGRRAWKTRGPDDPMKLAPQYIREPEAVELWNRRHGG